MSAAVAVADDFQVPKSKSKKRASSKNLPRVYIGNLPTIDSDKEDVVQLQRLLKEKAIFLIASKDIAVNRPKEGQKSYSAFVKCASNKDIDSLIAALHQHSFQGQRLVVQRERKPKTGTTNQHQQQQANSKKGNTFGTNGPSFGTSSWSKPKTRQPKPATVPISTSHNSDSESHDELTKENSMAVSNATPADFMGNLISEEMNAACASGDHDNIINTTLASLAAVSMLAPVMDNEEQQEEKEGQSDNQDENQVTTTLEEATTLEAFKSNCQKPLSELLADYGEEDPNWQAVQPQLPMTADKNLEQPETHEIATTTAETSVEAKTDEAYSTAENRLGRHGKAPIHVEFVSFGYSQGAPAAIRNGWHHAQPLTVFDCNDLPTVPGYLMWRDGVSGYVQRTLLSEPEVREMANKIKEQTFEALVEAIDEGGHGYVSPLQMKVYVGSECGRHRSVVVCEQTAKWLRHMLRMNEDNRISVPVSVGTLHRDIDNKTVRKKNTGVSKGKREELEDES